jgi:hypothetical protein
MTVMPPLAAAVRARGVEALDGFELTDREATRLVCVAKQAGMDLNCTLARANRFGPIYDAFPMTCLVLEPCLRQILDDLWSQHRPSNYQLLGEELAFADFVGARLAELQELEYLSDILEYERACLELVYEIARASGDESVTRSRTLEFVHDPGALLLPLQSGQVPPAKVARKKHTVIITVQDGELRTEWYPRE